MEGFFALPGWGAYIWRGLSMEGLIFGSLRSSRKMGLREQKERPRPDFFWLLSAYKTASKKLESALSKDFPAVDVYLL